MKPVFDGYGNELRCGDFVCFTSTNGNWRQTPKLTRKKIYAFFTDKSQTDWILFDPECSEQKKILASRVVKCY